MATHSALSDKKKSLAHLHFRVIYVHQVSFESHENCGRLFRPQCLAIFFFTNCHLNYMKTVEVAPLKRIFTIKRGYRGNALSDKLKNIYLALLHPQGYYVDSVSHENCGMFSPKKMFTVIWIGMKTVEVDPSSNMWVAMATHCWTNLKNTSWTPFYTFIWFGWKVWK